MSSFALRGLANIGATCYLNSILQILCNTIELRTMLTNPVSSHNPDSQANAVCDAFEQWFADHISESPGNTSLLRTFIRSFISYFETFNGGMQDQHEYLMLLLKLLHDSRSAKCSFTINGTKVSPLDDLEERALDNLRRDGMWTSFDNLSTPHQGWHSVIFSTFTGQFHSQTLCMNLDCSYVSHRFETFRVLETDIPPTDNGQLSLADCLKWSTRETQLDESDSYECDKCKQRSRSIRKMNVWRLPPVLIICVKRFIASYSNGQLRLDKNNTNISVPEELDMSTYMTVADIAKGATKYELYAIAHHIGNQHGGHCYTNLKSPDNTWFVVDDANIVKLSHPSFNDSTSYLLFYRKTVT